MTKEKKFYSSPDEKIKDIKKQFIKDIREKAFEAYCQDILKDFTSKQAIIESNYKQAIKFFKIKL